MGAPLPADVATVLSAYAAPLDGATAERAPSGLIQTTWIVTLARGERVVVQRMHPIFDGAVLEDLEAVTAHVASRGLPTPRLVRTATGKRGTVDAEGRLWRVLTWLEGETVDRVDEPARAAEAGALVARFHRAVDELVWAFRSVRAGVHDTAAHLARLEAALAAEGDVPDRDRLARLAEAILAEANALPALPPLPLRVTHGDLKISNVLFAPGRPPRARALIDLDTLGRMTIAYELGDAWRSWCNPLGEDVEATRFDLELFAAAAGGYAEGAEGLLAREETEALVTGVRTVCVELAARFCVDAFEDRYFGWDPSRFPSRCEHDRVRAVGQLALARHVAAAQSDAERLVRRAFGG